MKACCFHLKSASVALGILQSSGAFAAQSAGVAIPAEPTGVLAADTTLVQPGIRPMLNWNVVFPSLVSDVVSISPPGTITLIEDKIYVTVQLVGTDMVSGGISQDSTQVPTEVRMSVDGGSYFQLFYGTQEDVSPQTALYTKRLNANTVINFGGSTVSGGAWTPFYSTRSSNMQVVTLANGTTPPTTSPLHQSSKLKNWLKPYLDGAGKVRIGPMSVLVMMELDQTDRSKDSFDYQDVLLLVSFSTTHPNPGETGSLDGVNPANPGNGGGGPGGRPDPASGADDKGN